MVGTQHRKCEYKQEVSAAAVVEAQQEHEGREDAKCVE